MLGRGQRFDPAADRRRFTIATSDYAQMLVLPALVERLSATAPGIDVRRDLVDRIGFPVRFAADVTEMDADLFEPGPAAGDSRDRAAS